MTAPDEATDADVAGGELLPREAPAPAAVGRRWPEPASGQVGHVAWAWLVDGPGRLGAYLTIWLLDRAHGSRAATVGGWIAAAGLLLIIIRGLR